MLSSKLTALATMGFMAGVAPVMSSSAIATPPPASENIYVKFESRTAAPFYSFYSTSDCASGEILPNQQPCPSGSCEYSLPQGQYTFTRCASDTDKGEHPFDPDREDPLSSGIINQETTSLTVESGLYYTWQCTTHSTMQGNFFGSSGSGPSDGNSPPSEVHNCQQKKTEEACDNHDGVNSGVCQWVTDPDSLASECIPNVASSSCDGLPVHDIYFEIEDTSAARDALCGEPHVNCGDNDIVAKISAAESSLVYESGSWLLKSASIPVMTAAADAASSTYIYGGNSYDLKFVGESRLSYEETDFVNLAELSQNLGVTGISIPDCTTFQDAQTKFDNLAAPCTEVGNIKYDLIGACATGTDACVDGYTYDTDTSACKVSLVYSEPAGTAADKALHKRNHFKSIRKGGLVQQTGELLADFTKRKFLQMKKNTRNYFKQKMQERINQNQQLPLANRKKKHQMRKEERIPVSIAVDSDDLKSAFVSKLRQKFSADRDVGIIAGPEKSESLENCGGYAYAADFDDADNCITYDAAIDGSTTDVHILACDDCYNVGGVSIQGKYVPVVKQTLYDAAAETYKMSCWVDASKSWESKGTFYEAGQEVRCEARYLGEVVAVDTIVGSTATGLVDGDKCDAGFGCVDGDGDGNCDADFACEACAIPEANNEIAATPCQEQICAFGEGAWTVVDGAAVAINPDGFNSALDPTDETNANCVACPAGHYSLLNQGYCTKHTDCVANTSPQQYTVTAGTAIADSVCAAATACDDATHCSSSGTASGFVQLDTCACNCDDGFEQSDCSQDVAAPFISSFDQGISRVEESGAGQTVYTISATDNAGSADIVYSVSGADAGKLSVDPASGIVSLTANPDYEVQNSYLFVAEATDASTNKASKPVSFSITNIVENGCMESEALNYDPKADTEPVDTCCLIAHCTKKELSDAYAVLTQDTDCAGSHRSHAHTDRDTQCQTKACAAYKDNLLAQFGMCSP